MRPKIDSLNYSANTFIHFGIELINMTRQDKEKLSLLLNKYYNELTKTCCYDCYNCELGILEGYCSGHSCAIETVSRKLDEDLEEEV